MYNASNHVIPPFTATDIASIANEPLQEISNPCNDYPTNA